MIITEVQGIGHIVLNYKKVLDVGLRGILEEIDSYLSSTEEEDQEKRDFYEAPRITNAINLKFNPRRRGRGEVLFPSKGLLRPGWDTSSVQYGG
jgi:hypothetical protein